MDKKNMDINIIYDEIKSLSVFNKSKNDQIIGGIENCLETDRLRIGDKLPSVNEMIKALGFARQTIVNAYQELIERGIVVSTNRLGYFIVKQEITQRLRVCLILYAFDTFQETFYNSFLERLGEDIAVDLFFHHNNFDVFQQTVNNCKSKYGMYVIAPVADKRSEELVAELPPHKTLIVDRYIEMDEAYSYIAQEFKESSYAAFQSLLTDIKRFDEFVFLYRKDSAEPSDILLSFKKFIKDNKLNGRVKAQYSPADLQKGKVFFLINNLELWVILKDIKKEGLLLGEEIGILSHNDDPVKEIIFDGITTFSIDFAELGRLAGEFVLNKQPIHYIMPCTLYKRKSL